MATSYQLYDFYRLDLKYLVHIALKINILNFPVKLWTLILSLKVLASRMYTMFTCYLCERKGEKIFIYNNTIYNSLYCIEYILNSVNMRKEHFKHLLHVSSSLHFWGLSKSTSDNRLQCYLRLNYPMRYANLF